MDLDLAYELSFRSYIHLKNPKTEDCLLRTCAAMSFFSQGFCSHLLIELSLWELKMTVKEDEALFRNSPLMNISKVPYFQLPLLITKSEEGCIAMPSGVWLPYS